MTEFRPSSPMLQEERFVPEISPTLAEGAPAPRIIQDSVPWTEERVKLLKKLWSDGLSCRQIASELGGITRNAVIGKAHRLGLGGRENPGSEARKAAAVAAAEQRAAAKRIARKGDGRLRPRTNPAPATAVAPLEATPARRPEYLIPLAQRCTLMDLSAARCRWPVGDPGTPDFFFCGGKPVGELPYCAHHARIAYQPAVDRRKEKAQPLFTPASSKFNGYA